jgi:antitoxin component YwqK of YwqJK toxin-antitoxin module
MIINICCIQIMDGTMDGTIVTIATTTTTRLVTRPNSAIEYVITEILETSEDGTESKITSIKEYKLEGIDKDGNHVWYNRAGQLHRDGDLPAFVSADGDKKWYKEGKLHRDGDLPAVIHGDGTKFWFKNGKVHRDGDLPAMVREYGWQQWYKTRNLHRDGDLPAIKYPNGITYRY